jgi:15-cis-phytoene synthase
MRDGQAGSPEIHAAYRHCEQVTRSQARNFSYGIRLLPTPKRRALSAVYAFARRIDDIGDGTLPAADKLAALAEVRAQLTELASACGRAGQPEQAGLAGQPEQAGRAERTARAGQDDAAGQAGPDDPVLVALADASRRYPIPLGAFGELIDGCEADVRGTAYASFSELEYYCRCVAGSIGRLSLGIFGSREAGAAEPLADALGVALQLTNILRDIREDYGNGRVYLPADDLSRFGCALAPGGRDGLGSPAELQASSGLEDLVRFEARRAQHWYAVGLRLMPLLDRRSAACAGAMAGIYLRLLEQIAAEPGAALRGRMSVPPRAKAMVAVRSLAGLAPRPAGRGGAAGQDTITIEEARP